MTNDSPGFAPVASDELPDGVTVDGVFDALAHRRRREVVRILLERGRSLEVGALARALVAAGDRSWNVASNRDRGSSVAQVNRNGREAPRAEAVRSVRCSLHHVHLSKLADCGLVEYDRVHGSVGRTELAGRVGFLVGWRERVADVREAEGVADASEDP